MGNILQDPRNACAMSEADSQLVREVVLPPNQRWSITVGQCPRFTEEQVSLASVLPACKHASMLLGLLGLLGLLELWSGCRPVTYHVCVCLVETCAHGLCQHLTC